MPSSQSRTRDALSERRRLAACAALGLFLLLAPVESARADQYLCGTGPGPGEVMVGMSPATPTSPPIPICTRAPGGSQGAPQAPSSPPIQMMTYVRPKLYGVHVTDAGRTQLYSSNWNYSPQAGLDLALRYCEQQTGQACHSIGGFVDECQAIVIDPKRATYRGRDIDPRFAARLAMEECGKKGSVGQCRLWRLPLCSGLGYAEGNYVGNDNGRTPDQIQAEIETMTAELVAELR